MGDELAAKQMRHAEMMKRLANIKRSHGCCKSLIRRLKLERRALGLAAKIKKLEVQQ